MRGDVSMDVLFCAETDRTDKKNSIKNRDRDFAVFILIEFAAKPKELFRHFIIGIPL